MPSPSQRIAKAAAESAEASRRLAAAEAKIASTFMEMIRDDDAESTATPPPLPKQGPTPSKNQSPKSNPHGRQR